MLIKKEMKRKRKVTSRKKNNEAKAIEDLKEATKKMKVTMNCIFARARATRRNESCKYFIHRDTLPPAHHKTSIGMDKIPLTQPAR